MKQGKVEIDYRGKVRLMAAKLFGDVVEAKIAKVNPRHITLARLTFTSRPDEGVTNVTWTFYSKEYLLSRNEFVARSRGFVSGFLEAYNAGKCSYGHAAVRRIRTNPARTVEVIDKANEIDGYKKVLRRCAIVYVHTVFNHAVTQQTLPGFSVIEMAKGA